MGLLPEASAQAPASLQPSQVGETAFTTPLSQSPSAMILSSLHRLTSWACTEGPLGILQESEVLARDPFGALVHTSVIKKHIVWSHS